MRNLLGKNLQQTGKGIKGNSPSSVSPFAADENSLAFSVVRTSPPTVLMANSNESLVLVECHSLFCALLQ